MKPRLLCCFIFTLTFSLRAQFPNEKPADLKTASGKVYKQARMSSVDPDGVTYFYSGGVAKIPFSELPHELQLKYGYDPTKAKAFAEADAKTQAAAFAQAQALTQSEDLRKLEFFKQGSNDAATLAVKPTTFGANALNAPTVRREPINGKVIQVLDDGLLVALKSGTIVLVNGFPQQGTIVDEARAQTICEQVGSYEYTDTQGASRRVKEYRYMSGVIANP